MSSFIFSGFTNKYSLNKTIRFSLLPHEDTQKYINQYGFISSDEQKSTDYKLMKETIDAVHRDFIERAMQKLREQALANSNNEASFFTDLEDFYKCYSEFKKDRNKNRSNYDKMCKKVRKKFITNSFASNFFSDEYAQLFKEGLFKKYLPEFIEKNKDSDLFYTEVFKSFTVYFSGFHENRKNMYSDEEKSTAIAYRMINENLPRFIDNLENFRITKDIIKLDSLSSEEQIFLKENGFDTFFTLSAYIDCFLQNGIEKYNALISGKRTDTIKLKGLNEILNLHNQNVEKNKKVPLFKPLYKQILSDRTAISFLPTVFNDSAEMFKAIYHYYHDNILASKNPKAIRSGDLFKDIELLFEDLAQGNFNLEQIFISKLSINSISASLFGRYNFISDALENFYKTDASFEFEKKMAKAKSEKQREKVSEDLEKFLQSPYFSITMLEQATEAYLAGLDVDLLDKKEIIPLRQYFLKYFHTVINDKSFSYLKALEARYSCIKNEVEQEHNLNDLIITNLKLFLDTILQATHYVKQLMIKRADISSLDLDKKFYAQIEPLYEELEASIKLYDKVRNFVTKKPYSTEKFKLTFNEPTLAKGWDENKEQANKCILFEKDDKMFLGIINKKALDNSSFPRRIDDLFLEEAKNIQNSYKKMVYKYFPDITKMIPKCSLTLNEVKKHINSNSTQDYVINNPDNFSDPFTIPCHIMGLYGAEKGKIKKFQKEYLTSTQDEIGYKKAVQDWFHYCLDFLKAYKSTAFYDYSKLKPLAEYQDVPSFYSDLNKICYSVQFKNIACDYIEDMVSQGVLLLFEIHNKDYNQGSYGRANLHTLYWQALFSKENLLNTTLKLNGEAELFYRKASIKPENIFIHKAGETIINKSTKNNEAVPDEIYKKITDVVSGKVPYAELNPEELYYYDNCLKKTADYDIIKDKRFTKDSFLFHVPIMFNYQALGETKINQQVLECIKNNQEVNIIGIDRGERHLLYLTVINQKGEILEQESLNIIDGVNYHSKLDVKEKDRDKSRKEWKNINKISELKEGYLSHVIHKISLMVEKYNAIIVLEDLNFGFKRGRFKVEKQVYQKFEKALITKLNYLCFKDRGLDEHGSILNAYQLTEEFVSFKQMGKQNGILFYLPASNTSKIDPVTGFVDKLKPVYKNKTQAQAFFANFEYISYNTKEAYFEFCYDEARFVKTSSKIWTIKTYGEIRYRWNQRANQNKGSMEKINVTQELAHLFSNANIDYQNEDLKSVLSQTDNVSLLRECITLLKITLSLRYSYKDDDFILSPISSPKNVFYQSNMVSACLPQDADANGAYNIARKGLLMLKRLSEGHEKPSIISNQDWFDYAQSPEVVQVQTEKL